MYNTEQRRILIGFLTENCENAMTVEEIADGIAEYCAKKSPGAQIPGRSTVYRLLSRLCDDETVRRFTRDDKRFVYQISACCEHEPHLHLKCTGCGRLFHMESAESETILESVMKQNGFSVDEEQTVLFGRCSNCSPHN